MSTGELENRTLVCFASLAPSRQHQLPTTEEGAALGPPASLPTLARLIRGGHFSLPGITTLDPLVPCVHFPLRVRVQGGRRGTAPIPSDPSVLGGCCGYMTLGWGRVTDQWPTARCFALC